MKFSVLMSLYSKEEPQNLTKSLESVLSQTLLPDEIILVWDGPISQELERVSNRFASNFSQFKIVPLPSNRGLGEALNEGLKHCSHDLVLRMDTDDISKPNRFERQVAFMENHPEIDVCSAWIEEFVDTPDNISSIKKVPESHEDIFQYGKSRCPINHPVVAFRKQAVLDCGGYGAFPEDYYLWVNMLQKGKRFHNIPESLLWFRLSPDFYRRRGGWKYSKAICNVFIHLYRIDYITLPSLAKSLGVRSIVSLLPNSLRQAFYSSILRKS
ncbi:MAG: glycosyltransferase [Bacteroidales bacterium]|nr:glycosyltransferase [Bacteroidales bacterium]